MHINSIGSSVEKSANCILKFYRTQGGFFVPAALKLFKAKALAQLLYGTFLGPSSSFSPLERVQSKFLRALLHVPKCVSNAWIRLETGMTRVEALICLTSIYKWLALNLKPQGISPLILCDQFQSEWQLAVLNSLQNMGLAPQALLRMDLRQAKAMVRQRLSDIERQQDCSRCPEYRTGEIERYIAAPAPYLSFLLSKNTRRAFTLARSAALPTPVLEGLYKKIPYAQRLCVCPLGEIGSPEHSFFRCPLYEEARREILDPILVRLASLPEKQTYNLLLLGKDPMITRAVARFCIHICRHSS